MPPDVIALFGPTGVGKTAVAIALAAVLRERGEDPVAVSADALQLYRGLELLTGTATPAQQRLLEHRLVSIASVDDAFSAGRFAQLAHAEIDGLIAAGRRPIVVGGTGLYLRAALADLSLAPPPPPGLRERLTAELADHGPERLHARLAAADPARAAAIAPTDRQRIVRALELLEAPGADPAGSTATELWSTATRRPTVLIGLTKQREALYAAIDSRVRAMVAAGAADEVRRADAAGASPNVRKAVGFAELLDGDVAAMQQRTRRYAKRQLTWMRKLPAAQLIDMTDTTPAAVAAEILERIRAQ